MIPRQAGPRVGQNVGITWDERGLYLSDGSLKEPYAFQPTQLRDSCTCPKCRDPSSGQKSFATADIPRDTSIQNVTTHQDKGLLITLVSESSSSSADDASSSHQVTLSHEQISQILRTRQQRQAISARLTTRRRFGQENWDAQTLARRVRKVEYEEYMQGGAAYWSVVRDLVRWGVVFLKNVPREVDSIEKITTRIAHIHETFYGKTFDVKAKPQAENVAYTSGYLGLHQDLLYLDPPPHIQVLHCLENSCSGGESLFSDGDRVARMLWHLRDEFPIKSLADIKIPYAYDRNGHRYRQERTMLAGENDEQGSPTYGNFFWSPPFQGVFDRPVDMESWIRAAKVFESMVNADEAVYKTKMEPGDAVFFDNLRVLHGRTAFDVEGGGSRWLRGAYIDRQDFFSAASNAPGTHAVAMGEEVGLWDERRHMEDLTASPWYRELLTRLRDT